MTKAKLFAGLCAAASLCAPVGAMAWTKGYVVEWHDLAFLYGGPAGGNGDSKGSDCPNGTNADNDWKTLLKTKWRTDADVAKILDPEFNHQKMYEEFALRGPNREDILQHPTSVPDPGMVFVGGKLSEGFDLDDNARTGFIGVDGTPGIDNEFYRVSGCIFGMRGPPRKAMWQMQQNDGMHDGVFTIVFVLSGNGADPRNDPGATFGIYMAKENMVKDANGAIAADYSFTVDPDPKFSTVMKVAIKDGVVTNTERQTLRMRDFPTPANSPKELVLYRSKIRFEMKPNGALVGMVGGYRDWMEYYKGQNGNGSAILGTIHENLWHMSMPAWYYALRRTADAIPDPKTGRNTAISTAYRIDALPAFVTVPGSAELMVAVKE